MKEHIRNDNGAEVVVIVFGKRIDGKAQAARFNAAEAGEARAVAERLKFKLLALSSPEA
jgi:hypothetical protein